MTKKLAFCFLIYDTFNQVEVWNTFFENVDPVKYTIYIHYKIDIPIPYFNKYKLKNTIETKWADISLIKAQNLLLQEGLKDPDNTNFIFLSNSCIPLKPFNIIYSSLSIDKSYFNLFSNQSIEYTLNQGTLVNYEQRNVLINKYKYKAHQWCILNRKHATIMVNNEPLYIDWFTEENVAPDEYCYIATIYYLKLDNEIITTNHSANNATTFTNWSNMNYRYSVNISPSYKIYNNYGLKNYDFISDEELEYLFNSRCFFGRKFTSNIILINRLRIRSM